MSDRPTHITTSQLPALSLCHGKYNAERGLPPEPPGPEAESGTRIHAALAGGPWFELPQEEKDTALLCAKLRDKLMENVFGCQTIDELKEAGCEIILEERLEHEGEPEFSGKPDLVVVDEGLTGLVVDYKTGRTEVQADMSWQLAGLVALVDEHYDCGEIYAAIVQPWAKWQPPVKYDRDSIDTATNKVSALLHRCYAKSAKRTPHPDACRFCRAKTTCPEALAVVKSVQVNAVRSMRDMTPSERGMRLEQYQIVRQIIAKHEEEARELIDQDASAVDGWRLKPGRAVRTVTDPEAVFGWWFNEYGPAVEQAEFMKYVKVLIGKLEKDIKVKLPEEFVTTKQAAPSLERVKG